MEQGLHKVAELLYKTQAGGAAGAAGEGPAPGGAQGAKPEGDVIDAEYTEDKRGD